MADVRELLARLSAGTVRFDTGKGGTPTLTPQDIAGALGMVRAGLGRDLLEFLYGPDMGVCPVGRRRIVAQLCQIAINNGQRLRWEAIDAKAVLEIARINAQVSNDRSRATHESLRALERAEVKAREAQWPEKLGEKAVAIADIVIDHLRGERLPNTGRAKRLGIDESTYRERWAGVVDHLLTEAIDAEQEAASQLRAAMSRAVY